MNRSFTIAADGANDGPGQRPSQPQTVSPRATRASMVVGPPPRDTRSKLSSSTSAMDSSHSNKLRSSSTSTSNSMAKNSSRIKKKVRKSSRTNEGGEASSKSTASPLPPSARDPPLPPKEERPPKQQSSLSKAAAMAQQRKSTNGIPGASAARAGVRRDRSGLSRAQQSRLSSSSPGLNYVHEAQQQAAQSTTDAAPQPQRRARRTSVTKRSSDVATKTTTASSAAARKNSRSPSASDARRQSKQRMAALDRSELSSSRRTLDRSEPSISSMSRSERMARSNPGASSRRRMTLMNDRSDPSHNAIGPTRRRRRTTKKSLPTNKPRRASASVPEPSEGSNSEAEEDTREKGEESTVNGSLPDLAPAPPPAPSIAPERKSRKQSVLNKPEGGKEKEEKGHWWKSWSRISFRGNENFLDTSRHQEDMRAATEPKESKNKKKRSSVTSGAPSHLNSIELLQQLVNSDDSATNDDSRKSNDPLAINPAPTFASGVLEEEDPAIHKNSMRKTKSAPDLPKQGSGHASSNHRGGKRNSTKSEKVVQSTTTSNSKQRKSTTKQRKSKGLRGSSKQQDMENSISNQSLTMSMLGDMDARTARTRRTEKTDPVTGDEASMGLSSSVGFGVSSSMMSSGMMSAMSSLTGGSSRHTFNQSSSTWNNNSSTRSSFHNSRSSAKGGLPQNINVGNNSSVVTKVTRAEQELESVAESEPSNDAPTFAEDSTENSSVDKPQQQPTASRPVKELTSFLNEFDDLDALFTHGLEAVGMEDPIEEGSKETATKYSPEGSPELEDNKTTPSSTPSKPHKKEKRKSRAGDVLKRFMKNFDDLDILFSRKVIKDDNLVAKNNSMESTSRHSKDDIGVGASKKRGKPQKRRSSFSEASDRPKDIETPTRRKSHANILTSQPNILKEMLTMSTHDLENLFAKQAEEKLAAEREAAALAEANNKSESLNPKRDNVPLSLTSIKDRIQRKKFPSGRDELSKISEEPSSAGEHRRSISSFECSLSNTSSLQKSPQAKVVNRASLTLEDLMTPDLEYDTDEDKAAEAAAGDQVKKRDSLMKSENLHEVRRKGARDAVAATQSKMSNSENLGSRRKSLRGNESSASISFPVNEPRQKPKLETTKEAVIDRVHRTLANRLNSSEGSMSPAEDGSPSPTSPVEETEAAQGDLQKTTIRSLPKPGSNSELSGGKSTSSWSGSGKSLPTKLEASSKSKAKVEEAEPSTSTTPKPVDVLEILLERYDDYKGVDATKASLTTDLLDIDFDTVKAIKDAKRANPKEDGEKKRDREMSRRALARTNSLKREAAREEAAREAATLEQSRLAEQGQQVFGEFFPSLAEQAENSNSALLAPFAEVLQNNMPDLKPYEQGHSSYINQNSSDEACTDSPDSGPDLPKFAGPERRHSDTASFASYTVSRASAPNSDNISLPSQIGGPDSAFVPTASKPGSWADDLSTATSWRNLDDARSVYSERPGGRIAVDERSVQSEMPRRPIAIYSEMPRRPSSGIGFRQPQPERTNFSRPSPMNSFHEKTNFNRPSPLNSFNRPRSHASPWVDNSYYGDEFYHGQPNLNQRRNFEFPSAAPTINEFEAQFYRTHPHLIPGMPQSYGMYSSPDVMHYDQGYGLESVRRYYAEELMRSTSQRYAPGGPRHLGSNLDGGRSMSLNDVVVGPGAPGFQGPLNQGFHPMNRSNHPSNTTLQSNGDRAGGPSERRLSTSMHGQESEWEDFSDVARSGALQSIPWRSIRGLSYHQRLNEAEKERKAASLLLDDSFHWRFHHAVSKGCPNSKNEYSCGPSCCCKKCSPPWYHRPAVGVLASEEKEEDEEPSHKGRTLRSLKLIANSVRVELTKAVDDDVSLTYPSYDPALDVEADSSVVSQPCDNVSLSSFAG